MSAAEKLILFAIAIRPALEELAFVLKCLAAVVAISGAIALYALWWSGLSFSGKSAREAALRAWNSSDG